MRLSKLTQELALALEVASIQQAWGNPLPFQDKINELLVKAGRKPVAPNNCVQAEDATHCECGLALDIDGMCPDIANVLTHRR
jgi:hypothetical protein